jgi:hypothetical protein
MISIPNFDCVSFFYSCVKVEHAKQIHELIAGTIVPNQLLEVELKKFLTNCQVSLQSMCNAYINKLDTQLKSYSIPVPTTQVIIYLHALSSTTI